MKYNYHFIHHIFMFISAFFIIIKKNFIKKTFKENARCLISLFIYHQVIEMQFFRRLSFFDNLVRFGFYFTWFTSSNTLLRFIIAWNHGLKPYKTYKWRRLCLKSKEENLRAVSFPAVKPRLIPEIYTMPADGIDDFGGVPRHFTPPGAGGWDNKVAKESSSHSRLQL